MSRRPTLLPVLAPLAAAALTGPLVGLATWDSAKTGLLTALSVIAAATLVRLARGLPFTNADQIDADQARQLTQAMRTLARSLRLLLAVVLGTMILLVGLSPLGALAAKVLPHQVAGPIAIGLSGLTGAALAYTLARIWQIVGSDLSLLDQQSEILVRAVDRKNRTKDEEREKLAGIVPYETPEGYGQRLQ